MEARSCFGSRAQGVAYQQATSFTPVWAPKRDIQSAFKIGWRRLEKWRLSGLVRSVKLNQEKSGTRLYNASDVHDVLLALAAGKTPRIKQGSTQL